jgi:peroxiredoxin Q/BCP
MAPDFALVDQYGKSHKLSDYKGKWVVLYFYPKDDTPGCTKEACHFRDDIFRIRKLNVEILGVSVDNQASHAKFSEKHGLPFPLLADADGRVAQSYNALWSLGPVRVARRHSFIIDAEGKIAKIYRDVDPDQHSNEIILDLEKLQDAVLK